MGTTMAGRMFTAMLFSLALSGPAAAQDASLLDRKVQFSAGGFLLQTDLKARLNGTTSRNTDVDFDESLGLGDDATRVRVDALWRITPAHRLRFLYFDNENSSRRTLEQDIRWGDTLYRAGATLDSRYKFAIYELAYEYAFVHTPESEIAATIGVHLLDLSLRLAGSASTLDANGVVVASQFQSVDSTVPAPLPVIGLRGMWRVAPRTYIDGLAQFFKVSGDIDGRIYDLRAGATYMFTPHVGAGLGYNVFEVRADVDKSDFRGRLQMGYSGLVLYVTGAF
jgi:hypothetical protein